MQQLQVVIIPIIGMASTLVGVLLGATLTRRAQNLQWSRDRQIDACILIMQEANHAQFALRAAWRRQEEPDWTSWNNALATIALVAHPDLVHAAHCIDREIWRANHVIKSTGVSSEEDWARLREKIEAQRLDFTNRARRRLLRPGAPLGRFVARPPLVELQISTIELSAQETTSDGTAPPEQQQP
ncbi:hypothetical protein ACWEJ6_47245 [Nonomuraea sp. NPDC004702]